MLPLSPLSPFASSQHRILPHPGSGHTFCFGFLKYTKILAKKVVGDSSSQLSQSSCFLFYFFLAVQSRYKNPIFCPSSIGHCLVPEACHNLSLQNWSRGPSPSSIHLLYSPLPTHPILENIPAGCSCMQLSRGAGNKTISWMLGDDRTTLKWERGSCKGLTYLVQSILSPGDSSQFVGIM